MKTCLLVLSAIALAACVNVAQAAGTPHAIIPHLTPSEQGFVSQFDLSDALYKMQGAPRAYTDPRIRVMSFPVGPRLATGSPAQLRQQLLATAPNAALDFSTNGGFESGDLTGWTTVGAAGTGSPSVCGTVLPATAAVLPIGIAPYSNGDPLMNQVFSGQYACRLGNDIAWGQSPSTEPQCSSIYQDVVLPSGKVNLAFAYAVLASNPGHGWGDDPYFNVRVEDMTVPAVLYDTTDYTTSYNAAQPCNPWCLGGYDSYGGAYVVYRRWEKVVLDLSPIAGHTVRISVKASDCSPSAHFCEVFVDNFGTPCDDTLPPDPSPLTATCAPDTAGVFCVTAKWTAPNDQTASAINGVCTPGNGSAAAYDLRWSTAPILTPADYAAATQVQGEPTPSAAGTPETFTFCGLPADSNIYLALQNLDATFNKSAITTAQTPCRRCLGPDCSTAVATVTQLWPPNHQLVTVGISPIADPCGGMARIYITGVTQDEQVIDKDCDPDQQNEVFCTNPGHGGGGRGKPGTCPDAFFDADSTLQLRAERKEHGNGRVYVISFIAVGQGGSCTGTVDVCVPANMGHGKCRVACVDDGQRYDSFGPCPPKHHGHDRDSVQPMSQAVSLTVGATTANLASLEYSLPADANVNISVYDVAGRRIATVENRFQTAGSHRALWDSSQLHKGVYFYRLTAGAVVLTKSLVITH